MWVHPATNVMLSLLNPVSCLTSHTSKLFLFIYLSKCVLINLPHSIPLAAHTCHPLCEMFAPHVPITFPPSSHLKFMPSYSWFPNLGEEDCVHSLDSLQRIYTHTAWPLLTGQSSLPGILHYIFDRDICNHTAERGRERERAAPSNCLLYISIYLSVRVCTLKVHFLNCGQSCQKLKLKLSEWKTRIISQKFAFIYLFFLLYSSQNTFQWLIVK